MSRAYKTEKEKAEELEERQDKVLANLGVQSFMLVVIATTLIGMSIRSCTTHSPQKDPIDSGSRSATMDASTGTQNTGEAVNAEASAGQIRP